MMRARSASWRLAPARAASRCRRSSGGTAGTASGGPRSGATCALRRARPRLLACAARAVLAYARSAAAGTGASGAAAPAEMRAALDSAAGGELAAVLHVVAALLDRDYDCGTRADAGAEDAATTARVGGGSGSGSGGGGDASP